MVICLERGADLHMAQLIPLLLTVSCFSKIQIGFTFLVLAHLGSPGKGPLNGCVYVSSDNFKNLFYCLLSFSLPKLSLFIANHFKCNFSYRFGELNYNAVGWASGRASAL